MTDCPSRGMIKRTLFGASFFFGRQLVYTVASPFKAPDT